MDTKLATAKTPPDATSEGWFTQNSVWALHWLVALHAFCKQTLSLVGPFPRWNFRPQLAPELLVYKFMSKTNIVVHKLLYIHIQNMSFFCRLDLTKNQKTFASCFRPSQDQQSSELPGHRLMVLLLESQLLTWKNGKTKSETWTLKQTGTFK